MNRQRLDKRRRVALACEACRDRKVRCDGGKPVCKQCDRRGYTLCNYSIIASSAQRRSEQEFIASLKRQIEELQDRLGQSTPRAHHATSANDGPTSVSAMGASLSLTGQAQSPSEGFYGQSSVLALLKEIHSPGVQSDCTNNSPQMRSKPEPSSSHQASRNDRFIDYLRPAYSLPPRSIADKLSGLYFQSVHIFYPWIHAPSFQDSFERIWTGAHEAGYVAEAGPDIGLGGSKCSTAAFYCALNAMFALGCEFSDLPAEVKDETSAGFYQRMKELLPMNILDRGSLADIQTLLLVGQYLLCTQNATRCWNVVGLACRMALGIGLQSEPAVSLSNLEVEMRRRVWYACIQMDVTVSMTLGRPPTMRDNCNVPLPSPIDDKFLSYSTSDSVQPPEKFSINHFCVENIKLAEILADILEYVYHPRSTTTNLRPSHFNHANPQNSFDTIMALNSSLDDFATALPDKLHWDKIQSLQNVDPIVHRQSNVLHARYLHLKILLHRPSFTHYCSSARQPPNPRTTHQRLASSLHTECAFICAETACQLIHSLTAAAQIDSTGAWWYSVFYIVTSAAILILAESTEALARQFGEGELRRAWEGCRGLLERLGERHVRAGVYVRSLTGLREGLRPQGGPSTVIQTLVGVDEGVGGPNDVHGWGGAGIRGVGVVPGPQDHAGEPMWQGDGFVGDQSIFTLLDDWEAGVGNIMMPDDQW
ncbi:hypothetical protein BS50DRAFT_562355 [Corynespora cassiicola Philippines]|uniref:Zn(2)-C6 fungal-type domain-containing protein n=1 Tax=Corynespora cassiicola Philippines TaxID=1448308 RepID=A0A2T2N7R5_CORCC|nr:hypothetical protein BS50DRAFT_562355 [Corynespora cassiicola Philippines]